MAKKEIFISAELEWAESKLAEWKDYYDANPYGKLTDRMDYKETKNGGMMRTCVATIEQQQKALRETLKEYFVLLEQVDKLREREAQKVKYRGENNDTEDDSAVM